jgi:hypothetical protein
MVLWQACSAIHVRDPLLLHCSLMMCINIPCIYTSKCPLIVDNANSPKFRSHQSTLVFVVTFTQTATLVVNMAGSCITTYLTVYYPAHRLSSVSKSGIKSFSRMRCLAKIKRWEGEHVYKRMWVAYLLFRCCHHHQMAQVAIRAQVRPIMVEVHPCLCSSSMSVDCSRCHFGKEGSHPFDFREPLPGAF